MTFQPNDPVTYTVGSRGPLETPKCIDGHFHSYFGKAQAKVAFVHKGFKVLKVVSIKSIKKREA